MQFRPTLVSSQERRLHLIAGPNLPWTNFMNSRSMLSASELTTSFSTATISAEHASAVHVQGF